MRNCANLSIFLLFLIIAVYTWPTCVLGQSSCLINSAAQCRSYNTYCDSIFGVRGDFDPRCEYGQCRCSESYFYDTCTCLPHIGSCLIRKNYASRVGTPTTKGSSETSYSCVASDNCNYEVHVIGNYKSSSGSNSAGSPRVAGVTDVTLSVSGESSRPLILVLTSYEPVRWRLSVPSGVVIDKVILSSVYASSVIESSQGSIKELEIWRWPYQHRGYGYDLGVSASTGRLLYFLQHHYGSVSSFSGSYKADRWNLNIHRQTGYYNNLYNASISTGAHNINPILT